MHEPYCDIGGDHDGPCMSPEEWEGWWGPPEPDPNEPDDDANERNGKVEPEVRGLREAAESVVAAFEVYGGDYVGLPVLVGYLAAALSAETPTPEPETTP